MTLFCLKFCLKSKKNNSTWTIFDFNLENLHTFLLTKKKGRKTFYRDKLHLLFKFIIFYFVTDITN